MCCKLCQCQTWRVINWKYFKGHTGCYSYYHCFGGWTSPFGIDNVNHLFKNMSPVVNYDPSPGCLSQNTMPLIRKNISTPKSVFRNLEAKHFTSHPGLPLRDSECTEELRFCLRYLPLQIKNIGITKRSRRCCLLVLNVTGSRPNLLCRSVLNICLYCQYLPLSFAF